jgi:acetyl-CoA carboxylase biotin carboxyl carrier protein
MDLSDDDLQEIFGLLDASPYDEIVLETPVLRLVLARASQGLWTQRRETLRKPQLEGAGAAEIAAAQDESGAARVTISQAPSGLINIHPPLPGTFYRAPKPGAEPFVEIGSRVEGHTVVGIIETMKLMNSAHAGTAGEIVEICASNGDFVETQHVLMRLRPAAA